MKVLTVVGNRPQFIKSAPLSTALADAGIDEVVVHTGQHWDPALSAVFFDELGLGEPAAAVDQGVGQGQSGRPGFKQGTGGEREREERREGKTLIGLTLNCRRNDNLTSN